MEGVKGGAGGGDVDGHDRSDKLFVADGSNIDTLVVSGTTRRRIFVADDVDNAPLPDDENGEE